MLFLAYFRLALLSMYSPKRLHNRDHLPKTEASIGVDELKGSAGRDTLGTCHAHLAECSSAVVC